MNNITARILFTLLACLLLTSCSGGSSESTPSPAPSQSSEAEASTAPPEETLDPDDPEDTEVSVDRILMAIEAAYGDDYPAKGLILDEVLEAQYGLTPDMYVDAKGAMPMISIHNDQVVVVQAVPGRADDVEKALQQARQNKIDDTLQYPANIPKTNAAKVVREGDFVAFLLIGIPNDDIADNQSEQARAYAEQQVMIAVDAFYGVFE